MDTTHNIFELGANKIPIVNKHNLIAREKFEPSQQLEIIQPVIQIIEFGGTLFCLCDSTRRQRRVKCAAIHVRCALRVVLRRVLRAVLCRVVRPAHAVVEARYAFSRVVVKFLRYFVACSVRHV